MENKDVLPSRRVARICVPNPAKNFALQFPRLKMFHAEPSSSRNYGVKYPARCIASRAGEVEHTQYLVGTLSLKEENEVHVIQYSENSPDLLCEGLYVHRHEIWDLASCPFDSKLLSTVFAQDGKKKAAVWRMPPRNSTFSDRSNTVPSLELVSELQVGESSAKSILWFPKGRHDKVISILSSGFQVWNFDHQKTSATFESRIMADETESFSCGAWNPLDVNSVATGSDSALYCWDLRTMKKSHSIPQANFLFVRDVDFNPRIDNVLMSTGDDSKIRIWDLRSLESPLVELPGHTHWTWKAKFNPFFDELILSAGTDSMVNLWRVSGNLARLKHQMLSNDGKVSSFGSIADIEGQMKPVETYTEHEDSVYGLAWSSREPWVFASVSYDGRVVVSTIPVGIRQQVRG